MISERRVGFKNRRLTSLMVARPAKTAVLAEFFAPRAALFRADALQDGPCNVPFTFLA